MTKRKSNFTLDKSPMDWEDKETKPERIAKCKRFLEEETAVYKNSFYAQDLKLTIECLER